MAAFERETRSEKGVGLMASEGFQKACNPTSGSPRAPVSLLEIDATRSEQGFAAFAQGRRAHRQPRKSALATKHHAKQFSPFWQIAVQAPAVQSFQARPRLGRTICDWNISNSIRARICTAPPRTITKCPPNTTIRHLDGHHEILQNPRILRNICLVMPR